MIENLDVDVLVEIPFIETNDISVRLYKHQALIGDNTMYPNRSSIPNHIGHRNPKTNVL